MSHREPPRQAARPEGFVVPKLPGSNAVAAVVIVVVTLMGAIGTLLAVPAEPGAIGASAAIAGSGFTLAAKVAIPRKRG